MKLEGPLGLGLGYTSHKLTSVPSVFPYKTLKFTALNAMWPAGLGLGTEKGHMWKN